MGKKKKAKAKVEETPEKEPIVVDKEAQAILDAKPESLAETDKEDATGIIENEEPTEAKPEKDPEPVNKPEEPETAPVEAPAEEPIVEEVPEGMVKIPCECIKCKNQFDLFVPKGLGTPILYYRDCEKCR